MAQAVSRWPFSADARARSLATFVEDEVALGQVFL
jgi:hypothetical protein